MIFHDDWGSIILGDLCFISTLGSSSGGLMQGFLQAARGKTTVMCYVHN